jgi:hypothetical protein
MILLLATLLTARADQATTRTAASKISAVTVPRIAIVKAIPQDACGSTGHNHMGDASVENLARLKEAGINTIAFWTGYYPRVSKSPEWWNDPATMEMFAEASRRAKKLGMSVYYVTYLGGETETFTLKLEVVVADGTRLLREVVVPVGRASHSYRWDAFHAAVRGGSREGEISPETIINGIRIVTAMARAQASRQTEIIS